jgi:DNA-binding PadR family transcriptional regulator
MKTIDFLVLAVLSEGPCHGYALAQAITERSASRTQVRPGDLYRVLYRMKNAGLVDTVARRQHADSRRGASYRITPEGRRAASSEAQVLRGLCDAVLRRSGATVERSS